VARKIEWKKLLLVRMEKQKKEAASAAFELSKISHRTVFGRDREEGSWQPACSCQDTDRGSSQPENLKKHHSDESNLRSVSSHLLTRKAFALSHYKNMINHLTLFRVII
jgi:hypothetical protein